MSKHLGTLTLDLAVNLAKYETPLKRAEQQTKKTAQEIQYQLKATGAATTEFEKISKAASSLENTLLKVNLIAGSVFSSSIVQTVTQYADQYTQLSNKLKLVTEDQAGLSRAMNDSFAIAQRTASSWQGVNDVYSKFAAISKDYKLSQAQVAQITETVTQAIGMSGASAAAAEGALLQFGQALNMGKLSGQELNSVLSNTPALAKAIADGMGVPVASLKELGKEGEITTEVMINALQKVAPQVAESFAQTDTTVSDAMNRVKNQFTKTIGEIDNFTGASQGIVQSITFISENMNTLVGVVGLGASVLAGRYVSSLVAATAAGYAKIKQTIEQIAIDAQLANAQKNKIANDIRETQALIAKQQAALVDIALRQRQAVTVTEMIALSKAEDHITQQLRASKNTLALAQTQLAATTSGLRVATQGLLSVFGGPVGLALTVAGTAATFIALINSSKQTDQALAKNTQTVEQLTQEYIKLDTAQRAKVRNDTVARLKDEENALVEKKQALVDLVHTMLDWGAVGKDNIPILIDSIDKYQAGKISIDEFAQATQGLSIDSEDLRNAFINKTAAASEAENAVNTSKNTLQQYDQISLSATSSSDSLANSMYSVGNAAIDTANKVAQLNSEAQKYLATQGEQARMAKIETFMINKGYSPDVAKGIAEFSRQSGFNPNAMTTENVKVILDNTNAQENLREAQAKAKPKYSTSASKKAKSNGTSKANSTTNNATKKTSSNDPQLMIYRAARNNGMSDKQARAFTAEVGRENDYSTSLWFGTHKDPNNGKTNIGIISWQDERATALKAYLTQAGLMRNGVMERSQRTIDAQVAFAIKEMTQTGAYERTKDLFLANPDVDYSTAYKVLGDNFIRWDRAGKKLGKKKARDHALKRDRYYNEISAKVSSGVVEVGKETNIVEQIKNQQTTLENLQKQYMGSIQRLELERREALAELNKTGLSAESAEYKKLQADINAKYDHEIALAKRSIDTRLDSYSQYFKTERQLLSESLLEKQFNIQHSMELTEEEKQQAMELTNLWYENEVKKLNDVKSERIKTINGQLYAPSDIYKSMRDKHAELTMNPLAFSMYKLQQSRNERESSANQNYANDIAAINEKDNGGNFLFDEQQRYAMLEQAHQKHYQEMRAIEAAYMLEKKDAEMESFNIQMNMYSSLLGQAGQVWGSMTEMVKNAAGENSASYKAMFLAQQAIAIGQAIINTELAATKALAEGGMVMGIPAATMVRAMGYASVGLIASQTISGMAHSGIDNIPKEGTWLLDKGERVLSPRQNQDLTSFLRNYEGQAPTQIIVNVNGDSSSVSGNHTAEQKMLGEALASAVRKVIMQEQRQNGLLARG